MRVFIGEIRAGVSGPPAWSTRGAHTLSTATRAPQPYTCRSDKKASGDLLVGQCSTVGQ
nr:hypothetical protein Iba_chr14eCG6430 [Ipomoea batatas]